MAQSIKVRCNGSGKHVNEFTKKDLEKYTTPTGVVRGESKKSFPERIVIPCQYCTEGEVIITRKMIEEL